MSRGLVIGKFMPLHAGHIALIHFARTQCSELIVSMSDRPDDPISGDVRYRWLQQQFADDHNIRIGRLTDVWDEPALPWQERTHTWARVLKRQYPQVDIVFSSEEYGPFLAGHLNARHVMFDSARRQIPVSATDIRHAPLKFWDFLPPVVQPYFVKLICFYGPESTGKSTLARLLAEAHQTRWVPEVAREYITSNQFTAEDILRIGRAHTQRVKELRLQANRFLFCDTDLITTQIYSRHYLGFVPPELYVWEKEIRYDQYFLFYPDVPWVADGLRDLGDQRERMFDRFREELQQRGILFEPVTGSYEGRLATVTQALTRFL